MSRQVVSAWATYLRVSDEDKQSPERSFAMQRQRINEQLLARSDLSLRREYRDILTGTSPNRADYQQLLADAEAGLFSHLGLYRADRFGRNAAEGLQAAQRLMGLGIKIRVARIPTLRPETPDGFFMFLIQMGLAQREVDVLRQRTSDGMEAKLRAGGWPHKAPDGYLNKEKLISSGKYERWVELDRDASQSLRAAWDLLLTGRYTIRQICEELTTRGFTKVNGKPWAWDDPKSGRRKVALSSLHRIFHNPFYAGWVVSERFGIGIGDIVGEWEPIISNQEYQQGVKILKRHDEERSRPKRHHYLLKNLLWVSVKGRLYKLYGSTPKGRNRYYSYYLTHARPQGNQVRLSCEEVDEQLSHWLLGLTVDSERLPQLRKTYSEQVSNVAQDELDTQASEISRQITRLKEEEAQLVRMTVTGKISEEMYDKLRLEWQEKLRNHQERLTQLEQETAQYVNGLDMALVLLTKVSTLYQRLEGKLRSELLQIILKRLLVSNDGEIIDCALQAPFAYLHQLIRDPPTNSIKIRGSQQLHVGSAQESRTISSVCLPWQCNSDDIAR